jgi:hypothetical protein
LRAAIERERASLQAAACFAVNSIDPVNPESEDPPAPPQVAIRLVRYVKGAPLVERVHTVHTVAEAVEWIARTRSAGQSRSLYIDSLSAPARRRIARSPEPHRRRRRAANGSHVPMGALVQDVEAALKRVFEGGALASMD